MSEWFGTWFDSEYYHLLYKDRDYTEAEAFIEKLVEYLNPSKNATIHDLACGKGRHSIHLNKLGYTVDGSDYSANSIKQASLSENDTLHFFEHDMRQPLPKKYDYIVNLFTSFGYFETDEEHFETLGHIHEGLKDDGIFVFDFMNVDQVLANLVPEEMVTKGHIDFDIRREHKKGKIIKHITFLDRRIPYHFTEEVAALKSDKLLQMMKDCGFSLIDVFGNYALEPYDKQGSKRLIMILKK
ncbi:MAG: class I SAM-dependent DNA methyltransferase [Bacteroidia bacterium]